MTSNRTTQSDTGACGVLGSEVSLRNSPADPAPPSRPFVDDLSGPFLVALLAGDEAKAEELVGSARERGADIAVVVRDLVVPALAEIGSMWSQGSASIAEEHLATVLVSRVVSRATAPVACPRTGSRRLLLACLAGEFHDLGIRLSSDVAREAGWEAECLGANVPRESLVAFVAQRRPDAVALSLSLAGHLPECARTIEELRKAVPSCAVIVGGLAFRSDPSLAEACGADSYAADAVTLRDWLLSFRPRKRTAGQPPLPVSLPPSLRKKLTGGQPRG